MKTITNNYKTGIKEFGRDIDSKITYGLTVLGKEELNSVTPHYESSLLKSVMKQLDIDSNVEIPLGTVVNYQFGLNVGGSYEYVDYGNYVVYKVEKQEDTKSWKITCYDKMLYAMKPYESLGVSYPITIRNYINAICTKLGLTFKNSSDVFVNYDKQITSELYLDSEGNSLDYTYRDVLDELACVTASTICINDQDKLEIRYINATEEIDPTKKINLANFDNITDSHSNVTHKWENDILTVENESGTYRYASIDITAVFTNNAGKKIRLSIDDFDFTESNAPTITLSITDGGTTTYPTMISSTGIINTYTIPNDTSGITQVLIRFMSNNSSTAQTGKIILYKPILHFGDDDITYVPYGDLIDEEYLKDVNVNFSEKYGPVNAVVLSRSAESDNIYERNEESILENGLCEIKIKDNQILNANNRDEFLPEIYNKLEGITYYLNDFSSTGITYYDLLDSYVIKVDGNYYKCIMFNDEVDITQGLEEQVHTDMPEETETDYTKSDKTDNKIRQAYIIVDKQNQQINSVVQTLNTLQNTVDVQGNDIDALGTSITQTVNNITANITSIQNTLDNGVSLVKTTSVTIDDNGLNVSTDTSKISTTMSNNSFEIKSGGTTLAFFGYDENDNTSKAEMNNLTVTKYFVAGYHRTEKYTSGRTGVFYIGG